MIRDARARRGGRTRGAVGAVLHSGGGEEQDMPGDNPPPAGHAVSGGDNGVLYDEELCSAAPLGSRRRHVALRATVIVASPAFAASSAMAASGPLSVGTF